MQQEQTSHPNYTLPIEVVRLTEESWLFTRAMKGVLADIPQARIRSLQQVVDISCGPGDWALEVAFTHPDMEVTGIDFNNSIINYARARARAQEQKNVFFEQMNWTQSFDISNDSLDFVNGRVLLLFLPRLQWPQFLRDIWRVLRPGGIVRLIDFDIVMSSSEAFETMQAWTIQALRLQGFGFGPTGRTFGLSTILPSALRQAGFQDVHYSSYGIDFSTGMDDWGVVYRNVEIACTSLMPLIVKHDLASEQKVNEVYRQLLVDMVSDDFHGMWPFYSIYASKPLQ